MPLLPFSKSYSQCAWSEAGTWYFWFIQCKKVCLQQVQTEGKHYSLLPESWNSIIKRKCFLFYKSLGAQISLWDLNELMGNSLPGKLLAEHVTPELHLLFTEYISYAYISFLRCKMGIVLLPLVLNMMSILFQFIKLENFMGSKVQNIAMCLSSCRIQ